ncbi:lytic transglycosylase [Psychromarinibacter halotolerans]|uniref:Lytic transglycosylase n=1 Tax=Psychromarinibacter halotolerans TaxID=1775175 RepID=A0ABV7H0A4_9RHOB|nr:lytic transglycosylase [Psychromarinibacter halotolerans]MAQ82017.1 lytic transglycosylase [Maritimibacter sp.]MDF0598799.1 lytic transglycosylase [Psychromarinibacter halotolerans]
MSRTLRALILLAFVASCGGGSVEPPRNLDNACAILAERPDFKRAFRRAERKWGVPVHVQMSTIYHESKFEGDARTPLKFALGVIPMGRLSSAYGYSQALDGTWDEYLAAEGRRRAQRDDIRDATDFIGWYMTNTERRLGISKLDARNQYLAYHEGQAGYARGSFRAKPWLMRYADSVQERAIMYEVQLRGCR